MEETASPLGTSGYSAIPGSNPQEPEKKKWWKLPKQAYIGIVFLAVLSLGSSAYILFAPSGMLREETTIEEEAEQGFAPLPDATVTPTRGVIHVPSPTPLASQTASATPTPDLTKGWLTYTNHAYGYSFKYPSNWTVTDTGNLEPNIPSYLSINPDGKSSPQTALNITLGSSIRTYAEELALRASAKTPVTVNGLQGSLTEERNSDGSISYHVVIEGTNYTYLFVGKQAYQSVLYLIYPSFREL